MIDVCVYVDKGSDFNPVGNLSNNKHLCEYRRYLNLIIF